MYKSRTHLETCEHNPDGTVDCAYCNTPYQRKDQKQHYSNCLDYVKFENITLREKIKELEQDRARKFKRFWRKNPLEKAIKDTAFLIVCGKSFNLKAAYRSIPSGMAKN